MTLTVERYKFLSAQLLENSGRVTIMLADWVGVVHKILVRRERFMTIYDPQKKSWHFSKILMALILNASVIVTIFDTLLLF